MSCIIESSHVIVSSSPISVPLTRSLLFWRAGGLGFLEYVRQEISEGRMHGQGWFSQHAVVVSIMWFSVFQSRLGRVVVVVGLMAAGRVLVLAAHTEAKKIAQRLGEQLLEVE